MLFDPNKWKMPEVAPNLETEILMAARARIEQGWVCGAGSTTDGKVCSLIAITRSADWTHDDLLRGRGDKTLDYLRKAIGRPDIIDWNDTATRTKEEVLAAFDRAIELARNDA